MIRLISSNGFKLADCVNVLNSWLQGICVLNWYVMSVTAIGCQSVILMFCYKHDGFVSFSVSNNVEKNG